MHYQAPPLPSFDFPAWVAEIQAEQPTLTTVLQCPQTYQIPAAEFSPTAGGAGISTTPPRF